MLRQMGHHVTLFDAMLAEGTDEYAATLRDSPPDVVVLYEDNFNFLTKMCLDRMHEAACRMVGAARAAGARVVVAGSDASDRPQARSEEHTSELQSLLRISYAVFCLKKKTKNTTNTPTLAH